MSNMTTFGRDGNIPRPEIFRSDALTTRFGAYACTVHMPCEYPNVVYTNPTTVGTPYDPKVEIGMGMNNDILNYQFHAMQDAPFCGVPLASEQGLVFGANAPADCKACPCKNGIDLSNGDALESECDYGFARTFTSAMGPNGGNRNGLNRWG